nr:serine dehydratase beta chain [Granulicatella sp. WM01]
MEEKVINFRSCFDVIGPIMVGPSSSHTAGALQIGLMARALLGEEPKKMICVYYESFAQTHKGHGTDFAIVSGILGFSADDTRVPDALEIAENKGLKIEFIEKQENSPVNHANTADIYLYGENKSIRLMGVSVGGGAIEVRYFELEGLCVHVQGTLPILIERLGIQRDLKTLLESHGMIINNSQIVQNDMVSFQIFELRTLLSPTLKAILADFPQLYMLA